MGGLGMSDEEFEYEFEDEDDDELDGPNISVEAMELISISKAITETLPGKTYDRHRELMYKALEFSVNAYTKTKPQAQLTVLRGDNDER